MKDIKFENKFYESEFSDSFDRINSTLYILSTNYVPITTVSQK